MRTILLVILLAAIGCGDSPRRSVAEHASSANPRPHTIDGPAAYLALATASRTPKLVGPFANLKLTPELMTSDVRRIAPELCEAQGVIPAWCQYETDQFPGVVFRVQQVIVTGLGNTDCPIGALRVTLPKGTVRQQLTAAWGPPSDVGGTSYWFDPASRFRVSLHDAKTSGDQAGLVDLDYAGYLPVATFIGDDKALFGFEGKARILGATGAQLRARYGARMDSAISTLRLWPTDFAERETQIVFDDFREELADTDTVDGFEIAFAGDLGEVMHALERKWGAPHDDDVGNKVFRSKPRVIVDGNSIKVGAAAVESGQ
jgi:hypothetical protein